jgi:hypothetical protein
MTTDRILTQVELEEIFGTEFSLYFNLLDIVVNTKNVKKAESLMNNGYSSEEIKRMLPYQNWV